MIIEHTFITTLDAPQAIGAAGGLLASLGFEPRATDKPGSAEWSRGKASARSARKDSQLPLRLRLEFDRGRVALAGFIEFKAKPRGRITDIMHAQLLALESLLADGKPPEDARAVAQGLWNDLARAERRARWISVGVMLVLVLGLIVGIAVLMNDMA